MDDALRALELDSSALPEFGDGVTHRAAPCTAHELFCNLFLAPQEHVHFLEPALTFVTAQLRQAVLPEAGVSPATLIEWAQRELAETPAAAHDPELPLRAVREFAPCGLSDGAWLRGQVQSNVVETEVGMAALKQLMLRFGAPSTHEAYAERYAALLRSVGLSPESITRRPWDAAQSSSAWAYEHALLGLALGLFPSTLAFETFGFNLWMAAVGPCPLLSELTHQLAARGACTRYIERHDVASLRGLACECVELACRTADRATVNRRIARGFIAAQRSYLRWQRALLDGARAETKHTAYAAPHELESLEAFAQSRFGALSLGELYYHCANADRYPAVHLFGKLFASGVFAQLQQVFAADPRLNSQAPPRYSERCVAELVAAQYEKNVRSRDARAAQPAVDVDAEASGAAAITQVFDGVWLQGFADVSRASREEYGWLFRIYASEHGDGEFAWNHCQIFRRAFAELGPDVMLPKTDPRLYRLFDVGLAPLTTLAVSLNTAHFLPEILGLNLAIEATGVAGMYLDQLGWAHKKRLRWRALAWRLHNSIDNHIDGHTKWSQAAVQAFMRRVKESAPAQVETQWQRIWRLWRLQDILTHGTESERAALAEYLELQSLAPA